MCSRQSLDGFAHALERASARGGRTRQDVRRDQKLFHRLAPDQMLVDDAIQDRRIALAVPGAVRIDHGDRPSFADPQAIGFRAKDPALLGQSQLLQAALQVIPRRQPAIFLAAFRVGLVAADEDVPPGHADADAVGYLFLRNRHRPSLMQPVGPSRRVTPRIAADPISSPVRWAAPCIRRALKQPRRPDWRDSPGLQRPSDSASFD